MCHLQIRMENSDLPQKCCVIQILKNTFCFFGQIIYFFFFLCQCNGNWSKQDPKCWDFCHCMEGEGRLYLRGLLASFRLTVRMVGGCCGKISDRFGTSLTGGKVVHGVLVQEGGQGRGRWNEDKRRRQKYECEQSNCCPDERITDSSIVIGCTESK